MTHRQLLAWSCWLGEDWNRPDRRDHYAMQVSQAVSQLTEIVAKMFSKQKPRAITLESQKLKFTVRQAGMEQDREARYWKEVELNKRIWLGSLGIKPDKTDVANKE